MAISNLKRSLEGRTANKRRAKPGVETMEGRMLLTGITASIDGVHALVIMGTLNSENIIVRQKNDQISVDGVKIDFIGGSFTSLDESLINSIKIWGQGGDDVIHVDSQNYSGQQPINKPVFVSTTSGDDEIYSSYGDDTLIGSDGNDIIWGSGGNDSIVGGAGNDELHGGAGNDFLVGGSGADLLDGSSGFDKYNDNFVMNQPAYNGYSILDVVQVNNKSCQTLSSLAEMVSSGFDFNSAIDYQGNNNYEIHVFDKTGKPVVETVKFDGTYSDFDPQPRHDYAGRNVPEFWTILMQRARFQRYGIDWATNYSSDDWTNFAAKYSDLYSSPAAIQTFTGQTLEYGKTLANVNATPQEIQNALAAHKFVMAGTGNVKLTNPNLINTHVYAVLDAYNSPSGWKVMVYDPRSIYAQGTDDGILTLTWNEFKTNFNDFVVC